MMYNPTSNKRQGVSKCSQLPHSLVDALSWCWFVILWSIKLGVRLGSPFYRWFWDEPRKSEWFIFLNKSLCSTWHTQPQFYPPQYYWWDGEHVRYQVLHNYNVMHKICSRAKYFPDFMWFSSYNIYTARIYLNLWIIAQICIASGNHCTQGGSGVFFSTKFKLI